MKKTFSCIFVLVCLGLSIFSPVRAWAASFNLNADKTALVIGDTLNVDIHTDSEGSGVNAFQVTLSFPADILEVQKLDKTDSVVNFWLQEPAFSNASGQVTFIGGSTNGFSGQSLQILRINFKVKGSGQANLSFTDGAITASDGSGTNVLSKMNGLQLNVVPEKTIVLIPPQIVREAAPAKGLPIKPVPEISLYPDPSRWNNVHTNFLVKWTLPPDVTDVAAFIDKNPQSQSTRSRGLFDNEVFPSLDEGISYFHLRFKNNVGWGPTAHYRLAIDTGPPLSFEIKVEPGTETSDPSPKISYKSADQLSGLADYQIRLDSGQPAYTDENTFAFLKLSPGNHVVKVNAADKAGNETSSIIELNILPLPFPVIASVSGNLFIGEGGLEISGTALPNADVDVKMENKSGEAVFAETTKVESNGNWILRSDFPLKKGKYYLEAVARDERGALSYPAKSSAIIVRERPLLVLAGIEITSAWFFFGLAVILLLGFGAGVFLARLAREQRGRKILISQRDVAFSFQAVTKDIDKILEHYSDNEITSKEAEEIKFLLQRIKVTLAKQKYIVEGIKEIGV